MFISSMWDVKEPKYYSKRVGHEVPGVVAVLCEGMGRVGAQGKIWTDSDCLERLYMLTSDLIPQSLK